MTNHSSSPLAFMARTARCVWLVAFVLVAAVLVPSVSAASGAPSGSVVAVQPTRVADLVLVGAGFEAGLRQGMVCRVTRGSVDIAEIQLVELRSRASAALILSLASSQSIRAGDLVTVKVLKV